MTLLRVSGLSIYPVKSCSGINLTTSAVEAFGLQGDRRWMVVDESGVMLTQRKFSSMCLIKVETSDNGLQLTHSKMQALNIDVPSRDNPVLATVWADQCLSFDAGDEAASWLSEVLDTSCRLVYFPDDGVRQVDLDFSEQGDKTAFSDGFPLLLISQASLDELNSRLVKPVSMNRFRPNLVVEGCEPFAEDSWKKIKIDNIIYRIVKPCSRCAIPSINLETAEREREPIQTLLTYRKKNNKIFFGQNVIAQDQGEISVGMKVEIIE